MASRYNLTMNESKTISSVQSLPIIGYLVSHRKIKVDPKRLLPLQNLAVPCNFDSQHRIIGKFAYSSCRIPKYSEKIRPQNINKTFPLSLEALTSLKKVSQGRIAAATLVNPLEGVQLEVATDASDYAIAATLN